MLSLKSSINGPDRGRTGALHRVASILLQGISRHSLRCDAAGFRAFEATISRIRSDFETAADEDSILVLAGSAVNTLQLYSDSAEQHYSASIRNLQASIGLLADSLVAASQVETALAERLRRACGEITCGELKTPAANALPELAACLAAIADDLKLRRAPAADQGSGGPVAPDKATGLTGVEAARQALEAAQKAGRSVHAFAFGVERLEMINSRFGFEAGDQVLMMFAQHIAQHLGAKDLLFRWRGPCFLALVERHRPAAMLASEAAQIGSARLEHTIERGTREIVVPVVGSWAVFPISQEMKIADLMRRIDEFSVGRTRDPGSHA